MLRRTQHGLVLTGNRNNPMEETSNMARALAKPRSVPPLPEELYHLLRCAFAADLQQHMIDSLTPDRGYELPIDNLKALFETLLEEALCNG